MFAEIMVWIIAIEHIGIMLLEMFASPEKQAEAFDMSAEFTRQPAARVTLANQGIYNGALGAVMIAAKWVVPAASVMVVWQLLLIFVMVVAIYGGLTATKKILLLQFLPALIAFVLTLV
ncbi:MAG: DUF1304 domain-containing protein [Limosilactobacillus sp.]|uniref:DUF1304 domain-containing protein n=1 Tax=Limosilactobacillus sp. TaxID=2773925 RepID=UPI0026FB6360|nr:DUF1304 domain-containing protein [Limosilactobacillus sp.]